MTALTELAREITASDVMTSPVFTVPESGTIWDAWSILFNCAVRHVVVVSNQHCVGVVDDRDLVQAWLLGPTALRAAPIRELLHERTSCVLPDCALQQVAELMNTERVDVLPVVDPTGKLVGLITAGDVVHAVARFGLQDEHATTVAVAPCVASV